ncbi:MAG: bifunctional phosphopantothenoylcysteine decarboxylase/phosphopantothenate--cysteine ligase CoaBC [Bacteroidetes bacterium]|nr:bifunctional phosphopantothenoylcysteine decarboxylase/phosphopantothenate--cysteine ligase CoaBC [Bacteroidota bacterium]
MLQGKKILIGITGSISAYKIPLLVRLLVKEGAEVSIIMTQMAREFVTPLTLSTLSGKPVYTDFFDKDDGSWHSHVDLGNWADVFLIAPVSATSLGKMVNGIADNLLIATYLAAKCPVYFAPAMDVDMFHHPSTQSNIQTLIKYGNHLIEPEVGELASGLTGAGRLQEPENILKVLSAHFEKKKALKGINVLITAGPTYESIDPVRFIGNHSSGKMGYAIAHAFAEAGAAVELISGPVNQPANHSNIHITAVVSAKEMEKAVDQKLDKAQIIIMAAAVADYTPEKSATKKIKKKGDDLTLKLFPTTDILKSIGEKKRKEQILVGFALETDDELQNAKKKLRTKNLDLIVLNSLKEKGAGFGFDTNKVTLIDRNGNEETFPLKSKNAVAADILDKIQSLRKDKNA